MTVVRDTKIFEDSFKARDYIHTYYPKIEDFEELLGIIEHMHENEQGNYVVGTAEQRKEAAHEIIENAAIFDFYRAVTEHLIEIYPSGDATILDIGGGPTIYQHIALSLIAKKIVHSEFLEGNRNEVLLWLNSDENAYDWDSYFKLLQCLFALGDMHKVLEQLIKHENLAISKHGHFVLETLRAESIEGFKKHVRSQTASVVFGDMHKADIGIPVLDETFDIVTSNFVAESASLTHEEWEKSMHHMISKIKPGGFFIQTAIKNASWYQVGKNRLPAVPVDQVDITKKCLTEGCRVIYQKLLSGSNKDIVGYDGMVFTLAQKKGRNALY